MTESDWQGDMLRRITAEQSAGEQPEHADESPDHAAPPPVPGNQPAPPAAPSQPPPPQYQPQPGYQQQYPQQQQQQYPPPYQPAPPYEQPPGYQQPPYADATYYQAPPPYHQQPPGQAAPQYQQAPPHPQGDQTGWGAPQEEPESGGVFRRFRRIASEAAYLVGASGQMQRDVDNIATVRRPIAIMRRVGVLSPVTGAGTSTVTALLATVLSAQRADRVVAVDADPMEAELSRRLEQALGSGPLEGVSLVRSETTAEAVRSTLAEVQTKGARDVGLALVDCPDTMFGEISTELASNGHATVLVVPSVQHIATYALAQLDQLTPDGQDVLLTRGVIVITVVENANPESVRWLVDAFRQRGLEPVVVPYDAHVARAWPLRSEELQAETRRAVLDLAARVVEVVTRTTAG
ncbi:hypothetical protein [Kribbella catacumbae]|uniref:hypothetical protein n=1 Tax=Kribbella catacumbae TaxID=460086 RepID=UPI0003813FC4|nr:hypothetical protein [Kribbella catacumbae]